MEDDFAQAFGFRPEICEQWHLVALAEYENLINEFDQRHTWIVKQAALALGVWYKYTMESYLAITVDCNQQSAINFYQKQAQRSLAEYRNNFLILAKSSGSKIADVDPMARLNAVLNGTAHYN